MNSDIMFILDASGSIGQSNFESVREYSTQFIDRLAIGPNDNQIGVVTFSSSAQLLFDLDTYSDRTSLQQAIENIIYTSGGTNIPAALCQLVTVFSSNTSGARFDASVFRIAIFMTDGESNEDSNPCNFRSVSEASRAVHSVYPPILVYAIGVGSSVNQEELNNTASGPEYVSSIESFSNSDLNCVQNMQKDEICYSSKCNS